MTSAHAVGSKCAAKNFKKAFAESLLSLFRPKLVMSGYTEMPIPEAIQHSIFIERLIALKNQECMATETEALWYLSTASLAGPIGHSGARIMQYLCRKWLLSRKQQLSDFLQDPVILDVLEERELSDLRHWIYKKGMKAMKGKL